MTPGENNDLKVLVERIANLSRSHEELRTEVRTIDEKMDGFIEMRTTMTAHIAYVSGYERRIAHLERAWWDFAGKYSILAVIALLLVSFLSALTSAWLVSGGSGVPMLP